MIIALDVHYRDGIAKAVGLAFEDWEDREPLRIQENVLGDVAPYEPGQFYKRELPCLLEVLGHFNRSDIELLIVDGYVILDDQGKYGLGGYLFDAFDQQIPVIGVAKRSFKNNRQHVIEVKRGDSENPLYISAIGIDLAEAADRIQQMHGDYRMPDLLRILDQRTKMDSGQ